MHTLHNAQEFVRVGYYVNNEYPEEEVALREEPPKEPIIDKCVPISPAPRDVRSDMWRNCFK